MLEALPCLQVAPHRNSKEAILENCELVMAALDCPTDSQGVQRDQEPYPERDLQVLNLLLQLGHRLLVGALSQGLLVAR